MSDERHETIDDIVEMLRANARGDRFDDFSFTSLADRIEAAEKREREAGVEAAQICGEIGEMVGREAACHQPVTDCHGLNAAAMRKAHKAVDAALAKTPRNCDVGNAEEQFERFDRWCNSRVIENCCGVCCRKCLIAWSQMPYEGGCAE